MAILALEFSSSQRSVAVVPSGAAPSRPAGFPGFVPQAEIIETCRNPKPLGMVEEALRLAGLEREQVRTIAVGLGPGSYNGIRVAIALAQGWRLMGTVSLVGVSSMEALALQAQAAGCHGRVDLVIDAQRNEFYLAEYEIGPNEVKEVTALRLVPAETLREAERAGLFIAGPQATKWFSAGRDLFPRAGLLGLLAQGRAGASDALEPIYLRQTQFVKAPPPRVLPD